ncbi:type II toxin-antitoxin system HicA family toxin [Chlorogloeopsis fritschii PCC 9212]|uniref:type II toxin-antitoxin system HicA family toxin n=1 Tax=Chlorogloeopsis fritschii TaxID=1124 RepID=UPI000F8D0C4B|nr:type II toxin-antitoxin system HicA family toxin [Chlorogloeopsis fritschii]
MPRKIRELKAQIVREGFVYLPKRGKGSHERWRHPLLRKTVTYPTLMKAYSVGFSMTLL